MVKFVILFYQPDDLDTFENAYNDLLALVERMPQIVRRQVNAVIGSPLGETRLYRALEVYFEHEAALRTALTSAQGQEAGAELSRRFRTGAFEMYFTQVYEEAGGQTES